MRVTPFVGDMGRIDLWAPIASLLQRFRPSVASFPDRTAWSSAPIVSSSGVSGSGRWE